MKETAVVVLVAQSCLTLCDPMNCSPPGSSVHEIFQARILEWVAISFSMLFLKVQENMAFDKIFHDTFIGKIEKFDSFV